VILERCGSRQAVGYSAENPKSRVRQISVVQTFGNLVNCNPRLHVLDADGA